MKKQLAILLFILTSLISFSQSESKKTLYKGALGWEIKMSIKNTIDTMVYFSYPFQNQEYKIITDIGGLYYFNKSDLKSFEDKLRFIYSKAPERGRFDTDYIESLPGGGRIRTINGLYDIYLYDNDDKHTTISKYSALKMANQIDSCLYLIK